MILSQILINLALYGGIPLLLLSGAYYFGHSSASRQAALDELKSAIETDDKLNKAEQDNAGLEKAKDETLKNLANTIDANKLISLFQSLFKK